jgi:hypothetical protein
MGRPIKRKFFGVDNTADSASYGSGAGGEGISSFTYTNRGTYYSQGLTATVAVSPIGGTRAVIVPTVSTANGRVDSISISTAGDGYTTAPALTFVKPANVTVTGTNYYPDTANLRLSSTTGVYVGMIANTAYASTATITNIYGDGNVRFSAGGSNVSAVGFTLFDRGASVNIASVLANPTTLANTIQANAWTTTGTIGKQADIVSQRSSRRYRVTNADGTSVCRLVPTGVNGVNSPTVAQVISAGGPTAVDEMTILATDSAGGVYLVGKLDSRTALLFPAAIGGSAGTQFAANSHVAWTSTGSAVLNTTVKIASND